MIFGSEEALQPKQAKPPKHVFRREDQFVYRRGDDMDLRYQETGFPGPGA